MTSFQKESQDDAVSYAKHLEATQNMKFNGNLIKFHYFMIAFVSVLWVLKESVLVPFYVTLAHCSILIVVYAIAAGVTLIKTPKKGLFGYRFTVRRIEHGPLDPCMLSLLWLATLLCSGLLHYERWDEANQIDFLINYAPETVRNIKLVLIVAAVSIYFLAIGVGWHLNQSTVNPRPPLAYIDFWRTSLVSGGIAFLCFISTFILYDKTYALISLGFLIPLVLMLFFRKHHSKVLENKALTFNEFQLALFGFVVSMLITIFPY